MTPRASITRLSPREGEPRIYTVTEIALAIKRSVTDSFPQVIVQGEISNFKAHASGHIYFDLKDAEARLRVTLFRNRVRTSHAALANGIAVQVEGSIDFYAPRGEVTLVAERVAPVGYGALQAQFDALRRKLEAEGLFREDRKRPLPRYPTRIGIVTSPSGAALQDLIRVLRQRAPYARVTVAPAAVQGEGAAEEVAAAIGLLNEWGRVDVIIVGRGGGSLEDLWAFNEEAVVRAIAASEIPVVSGVGHEVDTTIADLAADLRAYTPTHAAQMVVRTREEISATLADLSKHARERLQRELRESATRLSGIRTHRALREPERRIQDARRAVDDASDGLTRGLGDWVLRRRRNLEGHLGVLEIHSPSRAVGRARERLDALDHRARRSAAGHVARLRELMGSSERLLESYDYRGVLRRGYALVWSGDGERLIQRGLGLHPEQAIDVQFQDARAEAKVVRVKPTAAGEGT